MNKNYQQQYLTDNLRYILQFWETKQCNCCFIYIYIVFVRCTVFEVISLWTPDVKQLKANDRQARTEWRDVWPKEKWISVHIIGRTINVWCCFPYFRFYQWFHIDPLIPFFSTSNLLLNLHINKENTERSHNCIKINIK